MKKIRLIIITHHFGGTYMKECILPAIPRKNEVILIGTELTRFVIVDIAYSTEEEFVGIFIKSVFSITVDDLIKLNFRKK